MERTVVAIALLRNGQVLAACRRYPPHLAGGWELPGGKLDDRETLAEAARREAAEELGIGIRITGELAGSAQVGEGLVLRAVTAEITDGQPTPVEHSQVRWLGPEELDFVDWIEADREFLAEASVQLLLDGTPLTGGAVNGATRIGDTVRRTTGPWTPAVHELLGHLGGVAGVPRVLGVDERGREILQYLPGRTIRPDDKTISLAQVRSVAARLRAIHDAMATFRPTGPRHWRYGVRSLGANEVVCHNDPGIYNWAFDGDEATGLFDWDMAGPGDPLDDVGFLAWTAIPLYRDLDRAGVAERLRTFAAAYGGISALEIVDASYRRMRIACERIAAGIASGDAGFANLAAVGEPGRTTARLEYLAAARPMLDARLATPAG